MILGTAAAYLMLLSRLGIPERTHLFEYTIVAILVHEALIERSARGRAVPWPSATAFVITAGVGIVDEAVQVVLPTRVFDPIDMAFNVLAALGAVVAKVVIERLARRNRVEEMAPGQPGDGSNRWA